MGLSAADFLDLITGFGGGNITNLRSSTTGKALAFGIVEVTEIVVEEPVVDVCSFAGNGFPGAFLPSGFFTNCGFTLLADFLAIFFTGFFTVLFAEAFLAGAFFATFLTELLAFFFIPDFVPFVALFLNNLLIATIPPGGAKIMAWVK